MNERKLCEEVNIREYETGRVEFQLPTNATFPHLMVYKENGNRSSLGFLQTPGIVQKVNLDLILKGGRGYCELWFTADSVDWVTKKIQVGWGKLTDQKEIEWEETAAKYREQSTYCRQRAEIHKTMEIRADKHLRPVGAKAHQEALLMFRDIHKLLGDALRDKKTLDQQMVDVKIKEAKEKEVWANQQDGAFPDPPEQKWYMRDNGDLYLKAKEQHGFDRRPHVLDKEYFCYFFPFGGATAKPVSYCLEEDWNDVARGQKAWKLLNKLAGENMGKQISNTTIYIKTGPEKYEVCSFYVPKLRPSEMTVEDDKLRRDMINKVIGWRNDPLWKHFKSHTDRWDRVLSLLGVDNGFPPMPISEIERLARMPWGYRWREVRDFLKE